MPKAYRVLAEKYEALSELKEIYGLKEIYYTHVEYVAFIKRVMWADTYEKFAKFCEDFIHRPAPVLAGIIEMRIDKRLLEDLVTNDEVISKVPALPDSPTEIKYNSAADYLNEALAHTLLSFTRKLYAPERAVTDREEGEIMWNAWHKAYTDYIKAEEQMKKASDDADVKLDI
jgi:hypothetical protein